MVTSLFYNNHEHIAFDTNGTIRMENNMPSLYNNFLCTFGDFYMYNGSTKIIGVKTTSKHSIYFRSHCCKGKYPMARV